MDVLQHGSELWTDKRAPNIIGVMRLRHRHSKAI
jgi:hypothetical protein